jgi:integrase
MHITLTIKEVVKIIEAAHGTTRAMLILMYLHGLRPREVVKLQIDHVDFKRLVFCIKQKNKSKRTFPIIPIIEELLRQAIGNRESGLVFTSTNGGPVSDFRTRLNMAKGGACITRAVSLHDLRHACATHLFEHCKDLRSIQDFLGFAGVYSTLNNTKGTLDNIRDAISALWDEYFKVSLAFGFAKPGNSDNGKKPDNRY